MSRKPILILKSFMSKTFNQIQINFRKLENDGIID